MRLRRTHLLLPLLLALAASNPAGAIDDIDVYVHDGQDDNSATMTPLVMFVLDYRPNMFSTICDDVNNNCAAVQYFKDDPAFVVSEDPLEYDRLIPTSGKLNFFQLLTLALKKVAHNLKNVQIGLMLSHNHENNCAGPNKTGCSNGAYILYGFKEFGTGDANTDPNKITFFDKLRAIPSIDANGTGHSYQGKELYFELFRYLTGQAIHNGHNGWTDFRTDKTQNLPDDKPLLSWDATIENGTSYNNPLQDHCSKVFVINLLGGTANQEDDSDSAIAAARASGGMDLSFIKGKPKFEDVLSWMNKTDLATDLNGDQNVVSFFMTRADRTNVDSYALKGGSGQAILLSTDPATLVSQINSIFIQVNSTSTSFVAASVPVNVFTRGEIMDNVYIALFQAETNPRWPGNLKKLRFNDKRTLLMDASTPNPIDAIHTDGRIKYNALTHWTVAASLPAPRENTLEQAEKDGRVVDRGGAGQKMPGFLTGSVGAANSESGARQLFTEPDTVNNGTVTPLRALNADDATAAALQTDLGTAAATTTNAKCLLRYIRGFNVSSLDTCTDTTHRDWLLGDVLHGRPLAISYGARTGYTADNPDIRILMNGNDGFVHMFRDTDGKEMWGFMPRAVMPIINTLRTNPAGGEHVYGVDGAPVTYIKDNNHDGTIDASAGDKVYLFFGLRRGGKAYYALDITNPDSPQMLWRITKSGDFGELGLTYSAPRVAEIDYGSGRKPVLVFGGGYSTNKDSWDVGTNDDEGNALYIVDAATGTLVWKAVQTGTAGTTVFVHSDLNDSIPSEITTVDSDGNGLLDRIYVGDTGGVVWRADLVGNNRSNWTLTKLLSVGRHAHPDSSAFDRRFFHRPDFVMAKDADGAFDAVIIGSGDRIHPTTEGVIDYFYMFKDRNTTSGNLPDDFETMDDADLTDVTDFCDGGCELPTGTTLPNGWRMELEASGEKTLATPLTVAGTIYFTTYIPANSDALSTTCSPQEGAGRLYKVSLQTGFAVANLNTKNGDTKDETDRYEDLASGGIPAEVIPIPPDKVLAPDLKTHDIETKSSWPTYWYKVEQ